MVIVLGGGEVQLGIFGCVLFPHLIFICMGGGLGSSIKELLLLFLLISSPIVNFKNMSIGNDF